jgi:hypothetical protein
MNMNNRQMNNNYHCFNNSNTLFSLSKVFWLTVLICCFSFQGECQSSESDKINEVSNKDYAVYTSFFASEQLPAIEIPQFFRYAVEARKVYENTIIAKAIKSEELTELGKTFGEEFNSLYKDYKKNNTTEFVVKERIKVPDLTIQTKAEKEKSLSGMLVEVPSHLTGEYVSLSRAGFNKTGDTAFFQITWNGSAVTNYYVMMRKQDNKWVIKMVEMENMIIF